MSAQAKCNLCGYSGPMIPMFPVQNIAQCKECGLKFYVGSFDFGELYTGDYFIGGEYQDYSAEQRIHESNFFPRVRDLQKIHPHGKLFEIGCAYGFFLNSAKGVWDVKGIDVVPEGIEFAKNKLGLNAILGDYLNSPDELESYDIVCMWDTIEHLKDPSAYIEKASRWLKPGGFLIVSTGDIDSWVARIRGEKWRQIHPPTHLYYFSKNTLTKMMEKFGLKTIHSKYVGYQRSYQFMVHRTLSYGSSRRSLLEKVLTLNNRIDFPIYLNLFDIIMVVAQKPK